MADEPVESAPVAPAPPARPSPSRHAQPPARPAPAPVQSSPERDKMIADAVSRRNESQALTRLRLSANPPPGLMSPR